MNVIEQQLIRYCKSIFTFIYRYFFVLIFLFVEIKIAIVFKKIFAIFEIKVRNFVVLTILDNLKSNKDNLNIKSCNYNNKEETFLKEFKFYFFFLVLFFISFVIFRF